MLMPPVNDYNRIFALTNVFGNVAISSFHLMLTDNSLVAYRMSDYVRPKKKLITKFSCTKTAIA